MGTRTEMTGTADSFSDATANLRIEKNLVMTPAADDFLTDLSRRTGLTEGKVLLLALGMLKTAIDAREEGKHVGVAAKREGLDIEFVGF